MRQAMTAQDMADRNKKTGQKPAKQNGAIIVVGSVFIAVILTITAIAIDLNFIYASREQMQQYTKFLSLAAIEQHFATDCSDRNIQQCMDYRKSEVESRMNELIPQYYLLNHADISISPEFSTQGIETTYKGGRWINNTDELNDNIACDNNLSPPGFMTVDTDYNLINSFEVTTSYPFHLAARFTNKILGIADRKITVSATASVTPRRTCVLVDISPSLVRETHLLFNQGTVGQSNFKHASEYAFYLRDDNNAPYLTAHDRKWHGYTPPANTPGHTYIGIKNMSRNADTVTDSQVHYGNDYIKKKTLSDEHYNDYYRNYHPDPGTSASYSSDGGWYRVDNFTDSIYQGPEPLRTVFIGLRSLIEQFKSRSVSGDKMCLVFYDNTLAWPRVVKLTDNFDYLLELADFDNINGMIEDEDHIDDLDLLDMKNGREHAVRHKLFPGLSAYSDTFAAFQEAFSQLSQTSEDGILTSDFIIHIGDGLANCPHLPDRALNSGFTGTEISNFAPFCSTAFSQQLGCANNAYSHLCAINMVKTLVRKEAVSRNIPVHVIQVGQDVAPHTVDIPDPKNEKQCLTREIEIRGLGLTASYVMGGSADGEPYYLSYSYNGQTFYIMHRMAQMALDFNNMSSDSPYYQSSRDMYEIALMTKGIWGPIRPVRANCNPSLESQCIITSPPTRRVYDPYCRETSQQIKDYMSEIMAQNPYVIVDVD